VSSTILNSDSGATSESGVCGGVSWGCGGGIVNCGIVAFLRCGSCADHASSHSFGIEVFEVGDVESVLRAYVD
jgi:hypothetical protein